MSERERFTPSDAENFKAGSDNPFERKGPQTDEGMGAVQGKEKSDPEKALENTGAKSPEPVPNVSPFAPENLPNTRNVESTQEKKVNDMFDPGFAGDPTQGTGDATSDDNASDDAATDDAAGDTQDT